jgi:hypothetical protein
LPYILVGIFAVIGAVILMFIAEPQVEAEKAGNDYFYQMKQGLTALIKIKPRTLLFSLLALAATVEISYEVINSALLVTYKFSPELLGTLGAILALLAALSTRFLANKLNFLTYAGSYGISLILSGLGSTIGLISVAVRESIEPILGIYSSTIINRQVESRYRATALSAFSMAKSLPYAVVAIFLGSIIDRIGVINFAISLGIFTLFIVLITIIPHDYSRK